MKRNEIPAEKECGGKILVLHHPVGRCRTVDGKLIRYKDMAKQLVNGIAESWGNDQVAFIALPSIFDSQTGQRLWDIKVRPEDLESVVIQEGPHPMIVKSNE